MTLFTGLFFIYFSFSFPPPFRLSLPFLLSPFSADYLSRLHFFPFFPPFRLSWPFFCLPFPPEYCLIIFPFPSPYIRLLHPFFLSPLSGSSSFFFPFPSLLIFASLAPFPPFPISLFRRVLGKQDLRNNKGRPRMSSLVLKRILKNTLFVLLFSRAVFGCSSTFATFIYSPSLI